ncbi:VF530 family DNA-binding protein [Paracidovorax valerianellae]|uniref:Uncharacterized conserved protein n=1 Tax=Paracidovorax valerianellae TaxID=187868 RepID=A0A1G6WTG8_9BURK|nr:VF530 family protein [Paracidovorax valerianellae]MDA8447626.1 VF530 family protein [Paracidovorax valerianellae]SDD68497.1 Uncharacterized conserved protein [Paracidovorax valerianellae]
MTEPEVPESGQPGASRETPPSPAAPSQQSAQQPRNPLHGLTLEAIVVALHDYYGWAGLADRVALRCFQSDPSVASSLKFLRKTPWAREKVESLYLFMLREQKRQRGG